jgi:hypothetical protein
MLTSLIGVAFVCLGTGMRFARVHLTVGPFEEAALEHMTGFFGVSVVLQCWLAAIWTRAIWAGNAAALVVVLALSFLVAFDILQAPEMFHALAKLGVVYGLSYGVGVLAVMWIAHCGAKRWLWLVGLGLCLGVSWWWELWRQPHLDVYGAAARHHVQGDQVAADALGILLGTIFVWLVALRTRRAVGTPSQR